MTKTKRDCPVTNVASAIKMALAIPLLFVLVGCSDRTGGGTLTTWKRGNGKTASRGYVLNDSITKVGDWVYFFDNGEMEKAGRYVEGQRHGTWTFWLPGGSESWTAEYRNGEGPKNGFRTVWEDGQKWSKGTYKNGEMEGVWTFLHGNGQKRSEGTCKNAKREGVWASWYDNGQKRSEGTYNNGEIAGVWTYWDKQGNVATTEVYQNGELLK